jgi:hypothetical protein
VLYQGSWIGRHDVTRGDVAAIAVSVYLRTERAPALQAADFGAGERGPKTVYELRIDPTRMTMVLHYGDGTSELGFDDIYTVYRDRVTFGGAGDLGFSTRFELDGDKLTFSDFEGAERGDEVVWGTHPWIRVRR